MGLDDRPRAESVLQRSALDLLSWCCADHHRPRLQPARGRPARRPRSATVTLSSEVAGADSGAAAPVAPSLTETYIEDLAPVASDSHNIGDVLLDVRGLRTSFKLRDGTVRAV